MPDDALSHPFSGVTDLFSELSRMRDVGTHGREVAHEERQRTHASAWVPTTDIVAQGADLLFRVELAGVDPQDVRLAFSNNILTVSGSRLTELDESATFYVRERFYGEFRRSFTLPEGTEAHQIEAEFDDGLVEITVRGGAGETAGTQIAIQNKAGAPTRRTLSS
ncbi:MAG: Hsp20/alpha crystallin family protein [Propionibacteriaceae bacterium]